MKQLKLITVLAIILQCLNSFAQDESENDLATHNMEQDSIPEKKTKIEKEFERIDMNSDNYIVFREYQLKGMNTKSKRSNYSVKALELSKKFSKMDTNSNQKVDIVEFEAAMTPKKERAYILKKLEIFSKIDKNTDNKIDLAEFKRVKSIGRMKLTKKGKPEYKEKKFAEIDTDSDGFISVEEFEIDKKLISKR